MSGRPDSDVAHASLACLHLLRERLLPDLLAELPVNARELNRMVTSHRHEWLDEAMPSAALPETLLLSNIAAFLVHAGEQSGLPAGEMEALFDAWFEEETSVLYGQRSRRHLKKGVFVRRYCCVRYLVPEQKKCATCPLSPERSTRSAL